MLRKLLIALAVTTAAPAVAQTTAPTKITYIHAGALLDRPGEAPRGNSTIIIRDGVIAEVRDGFAVPAANANLIELRDKFVLPGLIDLHVHLWGIGGDPMRARLARLNQDDADDMMMAVVNARKTLDAGFTTVRDLGGSPRGVRALRDAIERGDVEGPSIVNAGNMISITGGHGDGMNGLAEEWADAVHQHQINTCDGPDDCRRAVRAQVGLGAQVIKFAATGGVLSNVAGGLGRAMTPEEMRAIIDTAHGFGRKVAAHSHAAEGTKAALEAGVDTIEHGSFLDDEAIKLFKAKGAYLVPTMIAPVTAVQQARSGALPANTIPKAEAAAAAAMASHKKAIAAGVKVAFGTDTGVSKHGDNAKEFALLVKAGMTPAAAIRAATVSAADALGRDDLGAIVPGKRADIIAVDASPLEDVTRLEHVAFVMHHGVVAQTPAP
ncbi:metal-dependent hydrolase family protein [Sphingomonas lycopersici]|uniref:Amidohydrolase family protein n=1 Tax=Sphingomonas lycopersici TaxID=2951807 RepID=A0AA41ZBJ3_9SPHN|nr:amidohydrolase family protein [Sphingomonas lycopersici]MCW6532343.1 amidohydrolase family protein [Sphingomonas lycopersici]MCW6536609.1 amidohydrolase family protein [Sphingomonas lycopersici]